MVSCREKGFVVFCGVFGFLFFGLFIVVGIVCFGFDGADVEFWFVGGRTGFVGRFVCVDRFFVCWYSVLFVGFYFGFRFGL